MRRVTALLSMLICFTLAGCGESQSTTGASGKDAVSIKATRIVRIKPDLSDEGPSDTDDDQVPNDDTPPPKPIYVSTAADRQEIARLIKRYYSAALVEDGPRACAMLYSQIAVSMSEDYGQPPGPAYMRGKTCATVVAKLFRHFHHQIAADIRYLEVASIMFEGERGTAILSFGSSGLHEREFAIEREHGVWKADTPLGFTS